MSRPTAHLWCALVVALLGLALSPAGASAHSALQSSSPESGGQLDAAPREVRLDFTEPVETSFGGIRVVDALGKAVDTRTVTRGRTTLTALERGLGDGLYTVTYRVISADSHPISGGYTFSVGRASAATARDLPARPQTAGPVTTAALGAARALQYGAIALGIGTLIFLVACWLPAVRETSGARPEWRETTEIFARGARGLLIIASALGVVSATAAVALQGAVVTARPLWSALDPATLTEVLQTRFGTAWGFGVLLWLSVAVAALLPAIRVPVLRVATLGATGLGLPSARRLALLGAPLAGGASGHRPARQGRSQRAGDGAHPQTRGVNCDSRRRSDERWSSTCPVG